MPASWGKSSVSSELVRGRKWQEKVEVPLPLTIVRLDYRGLVNQREWV